MSGLSNAGVYFLATSLVLLAAIFIFDLVVRYKVWDEIQKGNMAVAFSTGGIVLGISNIMRHAITTNNSLWDTILWGGVGTVALLAVYFAFEVLTPKMKVTEEIGKGNKAVGLISLVFSVAFSFIISACIS